MAFVTEKKKKWLWYFSLAFFMAQRKLQPLAFQLGSILCPGWQSHLQLLTWKSAEQEPHHKQKHARASVGRAQEQNINHRPCLGRNSFCLVMAHKEVSCLSFWHATDSPGALFHSDVCFLMSWSSEEQLFTDSLLAYTSSTWFSVLQSRKLTASQTTSNGKNAHAAIVGFPHCAAEIM